MRDKTRKHIIDYIDLLIFKWRK